MSTLNLNAEEEDVGMEDVPFHIGKSGSGSLSGKPWKVYFHGIDGRAFLEHELVGEIAQREASGLDVSLYRQALARLRDMSRARAEGGL